MGIGRVWVSSSPDQLSSCAAWGAQQPSASFPLPFLDARAGPSLCLGFREAVPGPAVLVEPGLRCPVETRGCHGCFLDAALPAGAASLCCWGLLPSPGHHSSLHGPALGACSLVSGQLTAAQEGHLPFWLVSSPPDKSQSFSSLVQRPPFVGGSHLFPEGFAYLVLFPCPSVCPVALIGHS